MKQSLIPLFFAANVPFTFCLPIVETETHDSSTRGSKKTVNALLNQPLASGSDPNAHLTVNMGSATQGHTVHGWLPLLQHQDQRLLFTQLGLHRQDQQTTLNIGLGQRHLFSPHWAIGYNLFYDQSIGQSQRRWGLGAELWRDYFKVSANGYFPLSAWRDSLQIKTHQAKPAKGFDVTLQGYWPRYPVLGAEISYDRYWGNAVARVHHDQQQKNPQNLTLGFNYTPVPLVSFSYHYLMGEQRRREHLLSLSFTYRFHTPLSQQLNPQQVMALRSLAGSYSERVSRHDHIVLTYRESPAVIAARAAAEKARLEQEDEDDDLDFFESEEDNLEESSDSEIDSDDEDELDGPVSSDSQTLTEEQQSALRSKLNKGIDKLKALQDVRSQLKQRRSEELFMLIKNKYKRRHPEQHKKYADLIRQERHIRPHKNKKHTQEFITMMCQDERSVRVNRIKDFENKIQTMLKNNQWEKLQKLSDKIITVRDNWEGKNKHN